MGSPAPAFGFTGTNPAAARVAARSAARLVTLIARETMLAIRSLIVSSIADGIAPREAARAIRSMVGMNAQQARAADAYRRELVDSGLDLDRVETLTDRYVARKVRERATTIARTEIMGALNEGARESWREAQSDGLLSDAAVVEWITTPDEKLCPICKPLDGVQVKLGENFDTENGPLPGPPAHPRCLPGDALVAACGSIAAQSERRYDGDLVVVHTARGFQLACSPNHPILTLSGWVPAHALHVGGHVVSSRFREWETARRDVDHENVPARFHDVAEAARRSQEMTAVPVPLSPEDFHGDGAGSEVAVIRANRLLLDGLYAARREHSRETVLGRGAVKSTGLHGSRPEDLLGHRVGASPRCPMCGRNLTLPLRRRHPRPSQALGVGLAADGDARLNEPGADGAARAAVVVGQGFLGPSGAIARDELAYREGYSALQPGQNTPTLQSLPFLWSTQGDVFGRVAHDASSPDPKIDGVSVDAKLVRDLLAGKAGDVCANKIVAVDRIDFHGLLFNMETSTGAYWANGILTHNCRCTSAVTDPA